MYKVTLRPAWDVQTAQGRSLPPRLVELLVAVHGNASLAAACRQVGLSYRYAWGLLQQGEAMFGVPLVRAARGRGAALSPLGERLVWADRRIAARLSPTLDSLAAELESELERSLSLHAAPVRLQLAGAHRLAGFGLAQPEHVPSGRGTAEVVIETDDAVHIGTGQAQGVCDRRHGTVWHMAQCGLHLVQDREQGTRAIAMGLDRGVDRGPMYGLQQRHGLGIRFGVPAAFALA